MKIAMISGSMAPNSRSRAMLHKMKSLLEENGAETVVLDLRDIPMEFCDGRKTSYGEAVDKAKEVMDSCQGIIFGYGVYCYSIPGGLKNFIDLTVESMKKPFGQVIASGGSNAFLTHEHLSQIIENEVHAPSYPGVIFADYPQFHGGEVENEKLLSRMEDYAKGYLDFVRKLS